MFIILNRHNKMRFSLYGIAIMEFAPYQKMHTENGYHNVIGTDNLQRDIYMMFRKSGHCVLNRTINVKQLKSDLPFGDNIIYYPVVQNLVATTTRLKRVKIGHGRFVP